MVAEEQILSINLMDEDWAVEWLRRPQLCLCCEGAGGHVTQRANEDGSITFTARDCLTCHNTGYAVWFSRN